MQVYNRQLISLQTESQYFLQLLKERKRELKSEIINTQQLQQQCLQPPSHRGKQVACPSSLSRKEQLSTKIQSRLESRSRGSASHQALPASTLLRKKRRQPQSGKTNTKVRIEIEDCSPKFPQEAQEEPSPENGGDNDP